MINPSHEIRIRRTSLSVHLGGRLEKVGGFIDETAGVTTTSVAAEVSFAEGVEFGFLVNGPRDF